MSAEEPTAERFVEDVQRLGPDLPMRDLFALAKRHKDASPEEIQKLLRHPADDVRLGAVSIMDFQARDKKTGPE